MSAGAWLPSPIRANVLARVTAYDPGAWLDGEPWAFALTITDPGTTTPTDLTGSRLFVTFASGGSAGFQPIQTCDSALNDGSLTIVNAVAGQIAISAAPENRTWKAPYFGAGLSSIPAIVIGDVYRQIGINDPVGLTRLLLPVIPST